eukprot:1024744-Prorocentrum_minimum.AAC.1
MLTHTRTAVKEKEAALAAAATSAAAVRANHVLTCGNAQCNKAAYPCFGSLSGTPHRPPRTFPE